MKKLILIVCCFTLPGCMRTRAVAAPVAPVAPAALVQANSANQLSVAFSTPSRPGTLDVRVLNSGITVRASNVKDVIIRTSSSDRGRASNVTFDGLHRIDNPTGGLRVTEQNNVMVVRCARANCNDVDITVPINTNLKLSSQNGNVDVTLPQNIKATATMSSRNGGIYSDFDMQLQPTAATVDDSRSQGGLYRLRLNRGVSGTINGGGTDLTLSALNGSIYVRKGK